MKLENIIEVIENSTQQEGSYSRRNAIKKAGDVGLKVALASIPLAFASSIAKNAFAKTSSTVVEVLNFALTLEYLESKFYQMGLSASGLIPAVDRPIFTQIANHEGAHVTTLISTINSLSGTPVSQPTFDFTGGNGSGTGPYADVFTNYTTFLALSQAFEDLGVRAYKGQAGNLQSNAAVLTAALSIHSVEARHAAEVRRLRAAKGWITGNDASGLPAAIYAGEDNLTQGGVVVTSITDVGANAMTEGFDEPLTMPAVLAIADPFIV
ncbi:hypothetical protein BH10BAC5_BH10BAC5_14700 [soil metagenome]